MTEETPRRVKTVVPGLLYVSSHPAKWRLEDREWLRRVKHVFVLAPKPDEGLASLVEHYYHMPCIDHAKTVDPTIPAYVVPRAAVALENGEPVLFACNAGRNRSCAAAAMAYRVLTGCSGFEALQHMRSVRPRCIDGRREDFFLKLPVLIERKDGDDLRTL
jgi:hypothetical protein